MSDVIFGNTWHGKVTPGGLVMADSSVKTTLTVTNTNGSTSTIAYQPPAGDFGPTHYYKVPGLPVPGTPPDISAIGGEYKNDFILFGATGRYSPFKVTGLTAIRQWLHYGYDGKWRRLTMTIASNAAPWLVKIFRSAPVCRLNETAVYENTKIYEASLSSAHLVYGDIAHVDAKYDGRQIVINVQGSWPTVIDPAWGVDVNAKPFETSEKPAIDAVWRIDIPADCNSASATKIWEAGNGTSWTTFDRTTHTGTGVFTAKGGGSSWNYYENCSGITQLNYDSFFDIERLIGAAFSSSGVLHLVKYKYKSTVYGSWSAVSGRIARGSGTTPTGFPASIGTITTAPTYDIFHPSYSKTDHAIELVYAITIDSNGSILKTLASPAAPIAFARQITNNVFDFANSAQSICRIGPGAIDDTIVSGASAPSAAFNPRTGTVHTSATPISFV